MTISQKQAFIILASLCVCCGLFRIFAQDEFYVSSASSKSRKIYSSKHRIETDYNSCLSNLDGLETSLFQAALESRIDPKLLLAVMTVESDCSSAAISSRGAVGLMQILPATALSVGKFNATKPQDNIRAGAKYLRELKDKFGQDLSLTLAAYNAGPAAVRKYKGVPPYRETRNYVAKVLRVYQGYRL